MDLDKNKELSMKFRLLNLSLLFAGMTLTGVATTHASTTASLDVMATVPGICSVEVSGIEFGNYEGIRVNTTGEVSVKCNNGIPYAVALDAGLNTDGANRFMSDGMGNNLAYRLTYAGADWGDVGITDTFIGDPVAGVGVGSGTSYQVDAMLFQDQTANPGVYTDTVTVTVQF